MIYSKIFLPARPHPDTILAIFLLKHFGKERYPGIESALIEIRQILPPNETSESLEKKGMLALDLGNGRLDHHGKEKTLSQLISEDLQISEEPCLQKILKYGERDDKFGLGTISTDPLDKAFGLSGLISALNKALPENQERIIEMVSPFLVAHILEEKKKIKELPEELQLRIKEGRAEIFELKQDKKKLKIVALESDNLSMPGWLRSQEGEKADVVCQRRSSGYVNILTKQMKKIDLRWLAAYLRNEEAKTRGIKLKYLTSDLMRPEKLFNIPEWYYDRATNSILNGGTNPRGVKPTAVPFERIKEILKESLEQKPPKRNFH